MAGYTELRSDYSINKTTSVITGKRAFINTTTGTASLPELGDAFDDTLYPLCVANSISITLYHVRGDQTGCDKDGKKFVVTYSTASDNISPSHPPPTDPDQIQCTAGLEVTSIEDSDDMFWEDTLTVALDPNQPVAQPLSLTTPIGTVSKTIHVEPGDVFRGYFTNQIIKKLGKINDDVFSPVPDLNFVAGTCLFASWSGSLVLDNNGDKMWEVVLNFTYKILTRHGNDNVPYSHLYFYRKDPQGYQDIWQAPCNTGGGGDLPTDYIYKSASFVGLL